MSCHCTRYAWSNLQQNQLAVMRTLQLEKPSAAKAELASNNAGNLPGIRNTSVIVLTEIPFRVRRRLRAPANNRPFSRSEKTIYCVFFAGQVFADYGS